MFGIGLGKHLFGRCSQNAFLVSVVWLLYGEERGGESMLWPRIDTEKY